MRLALPSIILIFTALVASPPAGAAVQLEITADSLRLSGTVSSMAQRECLRSLLREASPELLLDHLEIDRRQMVRWMPVLLELLGAAVPALSAGSIRLEGDGVTIRGSVRSVDERADLLRQVAALRQPGLSLEASLSVQDPAPEPWIEAAFSDSDLTVAGQVSLAETANRLQADFPGANIVQISGSARSATWGSELLPALPALLTAICAEVADGSVRFSPGQVTVQGAVADLGPKLRVTRLIQSTLGSATRVENFLSVDLPPLPTVEIASKPVLPAQPAKIPAAVKTSPRKPSPPPASAPAPPPLASPSPTPPSPPPSSVPSATPQAPAEVAVAAKSTPSGAARALVFNRGSTWITPASRALIESALIELKALPVSARLLIRAQVDSDGDPEVNRSLSDERAASVRQALVKGGIASSRIETEIPSLPAEPAPAPSARRVELILIP